MGGLLKVKLVLRRHAELLQQRLKPLLFLAMNDLVLQAGQKYDCIPLKY